MWSSLDGRVGSAESAPCSRSKHSASLLDGYVWVLGGRGNGPKRPLRDLWRYSLATHAWERLPSLGDAPPSLEQHSCIGRSGKLYVFGGELAPAGDTPLWIYDTQVTGILTGVWRKVASTVSAPSRAARSISATGPRGRRAHLAFDLQDCMLIYGGYMDLKGSTNEMWAFHYESERWQQVRCGADTTRRHGAAGCVRGVRLYVHAGRSDLKLRGDLQYYDTESRSWHEVRCVPRLSPAPRCGHAAVRAGAHLYIFGGDTDSQLTDELWRFHFDSEIWERIENKPHWPSARVESCALLISTVVTRPNSLRTNSRRTELTKRYSANEYTEGCNGNGGGYGDATKNYSNNGGHTNYDSNDESYGYSSMSSTMTPGAAPPVTPVTRDAPGSILREISKISSQIRRSNRCSYTALSTEQETMDSPPVPGRAAISKSVSAHIIDKRANRHSPREGDVPHSTMGEMSREPISVPNFADLVLVQPVLTPVQASRLVYLDSDDERDFITALQQPAVPAPPSKRPGVTISSTGVRFSAAPPSEEDTNYCTSDYASAEKINRVSLASSGAVSSLGFCNPHYLCGSTRRLSARSPLCPDTPDSGLCAGEIELRDLTHTLTRPATQQMKEKGTRLLVLLVGGRETQRVALMQRPLSLWTYRLL